MSVDGTWDVTVSAPNGDQKATLTMSTAGEALTGSYAGPQGTLELKEGRVDGSSVHFSMDMTQPLALRLVVTAEVTGDALKGSVEAGQFGSLSLSGVRKP